MRDKPSLRLHSPVLAGLLTGCALFGGLGGWAATAPLAGATVAPAIVVPAGSRKTVQHLEGGIVRQILVEDGEVVEEGQVLVELDPTRAAADHAALLSSWQALAAAEARLRAEEAGNTAIAFPEALTWASEAGDPQVADLLRDERRRLESRDRAQADQAAVYGERIRQSEAEIKGLAATRRSVERQLSLVREETRGVSELLAKGLERRPRLLALQRTQAQMEGERAAGAAAEAHAREAIAEARQEIALLTSQRRETVTKELADTRRELSDVAEKLAAAADRLARMVVKAPVAGTVVDLRARTEGGVIAPGAAILDLVPVGDELLLEAHVATTDIDEVKAGLKAQVHLLAYRSRAMPRIEGEVREVSADRTGDAKGDAPYYVARITIDIAALPPEVHLTAGMPAEALIVTGERTFLDYLLTPLRDSLRRGLRET